MNKQLSPLGRGSLSRIIDSPFSSFIDAFFSEALPLSLDDRQESYPKYNILRKNKDVTDQFTIELSLAGFSKDTISVSTKNDILYVENTNAGWKESAECDYLYKGIAERDFKWKLKLPKFSVIDKVTFINGILSIDISIKIPESEKPKIYTID